MQKSEGVCWAKKGSPENLRESPGLLRHPIYEYGGPLVLRITEEQMDKQGNSGRIIFVGEGFYDEIFPF